MFRNALQTVSIVAMFILSAHAANGPAAGIDGLGLSALANSDAAANDLTTTNIRKGMFADWGPYEDSDFQPDVDSDPPLTHPVSEAAERFASDDKLAKAGWGTTLGLLPLPDTKISLPSPDVRLQERGIHFGALYRF